MPRSRVERVEQPVRVRVLFVVFSLEFFSPCRTSRTTIFLRLPSSPEAVHFQKTKLKLQLYNSWCTFPVLQLLPALPGQVGAGFYIFIEPNQQLRFSAQQPENVFRWTQEVLSLLPTLVFVRCPDQEDMEILEKQFIFT